MLIYEKSHHTFQKASKEQSEHVDRVEVRLKRIHKYEYHVDTDSNGL